MRKILFFLFIWFSAQTLRAQQSPWNSVAPGGSFVYTDLKSAVKDASVCYRLDLTGFDFFLDKKLLPKSIVLTNVMAFKIGNNNISTIPTVFLQMHSLVYFRSTGNALTSLSDSLGMWSELKYLELAETKFDTLPVGIYGCTRLFSISLARNKDTLHITDGISGLHALTELNIYYTNLDTLPKTFSSMNNLHKLALYKTGFQSFPEQLLPMNELQELYLDSNFISAIPRTITSMKGLTFLSLRGNRIRHVPSTICFLKNLATLDLRGNPIDPYEIKCLQALIPSCSILF